MRLRLLALLWLIFLAPGCTQLWLSQPTPGNPQPTPGVKSTPNIDLITPEPALQTPDQLALPLATASPTGPVVLRIWLPPQFNPTSETLAGILLQERLREFEKRRPGIRVEARVKEVNGPAGLINSLAVTSAAAPLAMPDLVALPREFLETAALKGMVQPYDSLSTILDKDDWFSYAQQLSLLQNSVYGMPFAGDALVVVYRPAIVAASPLDWESALALKQPMIFPAADPQALFTIALYQASGGAFRDEQGRPSAETGPLSKVFTFYMQGEALGLTPYSLTQFQDDNQVWEAFLEHRADMVITWAWNYLSALPADAAMAPIPIPEGKSFTLASGWVWALATHQPDRQKLAVELAEFLTESSFLAVWTEAVGALPPRSSALDGWDNHALQPIIQQISVSAALIPPNDVLTSLGGPVSEATVQILKKQIDALSAAQGVSQGLTGP